MSYGTRYGMPKGQEANYPPCPGCGTRVYYIDGPACHSCRESAPHRWCEPCNKVVQTHATACRACETPFGRLVFGMDRLAEKERVSGWTDSNNTALSLFAAVGGQWLSDQYGGPVVRTPKLKVKAPGRAWPKDANTYTSHTKAENEVLKTNVAVAAIIARSKADKDWTPPPPVIRILATRPMPVGESAAEKEAARQAAWDTWVAEKWAEREAGAA